MWPIKRTSVGATIGQYRLTALIGEGGMGMVFEAEDESSGQAVAMKVLKPMTDNPQETQAAARQFQSEAAMISLLDHPGLARALDFFDHQGQPCLVMELIDGRTLEDIVEEEGPRSVLEALEMSDQLLQILAYLHSRNPPIILRDLKPSNVVQTRDGQLKVIDFGIARYQAPEEQTSTFVRGFGSPGFTAIEQIVGSGTDTRTDLYSFGATLYYLLTRVVPPCATERASQAAEVVPPDKLEEGVPPWLSRVILHLMALRAQDRCQSVADAIRLLTDARTSTGELRQPDIASPGVDLGAALDRLMAQSWDTLTASERGGIRLVTADREELLSDRLTADQLRGLLHEVLDDHHIGLVALGQCNRFDYEFDGQPLVMLVFPDMLQFWRDSSQIAFARAVQGLQFGRPEAMEEAVEAPPPAPLQAENTVVRFVPSPEHEKSVSARGMLRLVGGTALCLALLGLCLLLPAVWPVAVPLAVLAAFASIISYRRYARLAQALKSSFVQLGTTEIIVQLPRRPVVRVPYRRVGRILNQGGSLALLVSPEGSASFNLDIPYWIGDVPSLESHLRARVPSA